MADQFELLADVRMAARNVTRADEEARRARGELGRAIKEAQTGGLAVELLAQAAGVTRVTAYKLMRIGQEEAA